MARPPTEYITGPARTVFQSRSEACRADAATPLQVEEALWSLL